MRRLVRENIVLIGTYALVLAGMAVLLWLVPDRGELHLRLHGWSETMPHGWHTPVLDGAFRSWSYAAEWPLYVLAALPLLTLLPSVGNRLRPDTWITWRVTAVFAAAEAASTLVVQVVKSLLNLPRPVVYMAGDERLQQLLIEGVAMREWRSFPSGHTSAFFVFFTTIALCYAMSPVGQRDKKSRHMVAALCVVLATLGGYSRIWLSQHFLMDVAAGSLIGFTFAILSQICISAAGRQR